MSYFETRMQELGLHPKDYTLKLLCEVSDDESRRIEKPIFAEDDRGNIAITFYDLSRNVITYPIPESELGQTLRQSPNARHTRDWVRTRYNPEYLQAHPTMGKYHSPAGQGSYPFFPPLLLEKYERAEAIETLVITEGEFKAMKASVCGIDCIGIGGITMFADSKSKQLFPDIVRLINRCHPQNIVILFDGDCTNISKDDLAALKENKVPDVDKRPMSFYNAMARLRDLLKEFRSDIYFAYVNSRELETNPKGLDDLLVAEPFLKKTEEITGDLNVPGRPGVYFVKYNLNRQRNLRDIFSVASAQQFYEAHVDDIGEHKFKYRGAIYQYNAEEKDLVRTLDEKLTRYFAIGDNFYYKDFIPSARNANGGSWGLQSIARGTLKDLYGQDAPKKIMNNRRYNGRVNYPSHIDYQESIRGYYNTYSELSYKPEPGTWDNIHSLLNHIFGDDNSDQYKMALDYFTLLYKEPTQVLPVICLVSKDRGTGKTSFLNLLKYIFENNATIGGNELILTNFNSQTAGKLIVGIDETNVGDNQAITEKIKMLSTAETATLESKGKDQVEIDNFTKFVLCSNNERKFIYTDEDEVRFWVIKLKPVPKDKFKAKISPYLAEEVPAFVCYLMSREMFVKQAEHRMWFKPERLETDALKALKAAGRSKDEKAIRNCLQELFIASKRDRLALDRDYFREHIANWEKRDRSEIGYLIEEVLHIPRYPKQRRLKMPFFSNQYGEEGELKWPGEGKVCNISYDFYAQEYLPEDYDPDAEIEDEDEKQETKVESRETKVESQETKVESRETDPELPLTNNGEKPF